MAEQLYTIQQVANLLQISERTVRRNMDRWPHIAFSAKVRRFTEAHVAAILTLHDRQPQAPRPSRRRRQAS